MARVAMNEDAFCAHASNIHTQTWKKNKTKQYTPPKKITQTGFGLIQASHVGRIKSNRKKFRNNNPHTPKHTS